MAISSMHLKKKKKIFMLETLRKLQPVILDPLSLHGRSRSQFIYYDCTSLAITDERPT